MVWVEREKKEKEKEKAMEHKICERCFYFFLIKKCFLF